MKWAHLKNKLSAWSLWFPFTKNFCFLILIVYFFYKKYHETLLNETDSYGGYTTLIIKLLGAAILIIICLNLLLTLINWLILIQSKRFVIKNFFIEIKKDYNAKNNELIGSIKVPIKSPFHNHTITLLWQDGDISAPISISNKNKSLGTIDLPTSDRYVLKGIILHLRDLFHLVKLPVFYNQEEEIIVYPKKSSAAQQEQFAQKTTNLDIRIDHLKPTQGDLTHFKDFEHGDDIRRIVWKNYAKHRQLIVKVPERFEPYTSETIMNISFYSDDFNEIERDIENSLKDFYKSKILSIVEQFEEQDIPTNIYQDQLLNNESLSPKEYKRILAQSDWQSGLPPQEIFHYTKGSIIILSSMISIKKLEELMKNNGLNNQILLITLSTSLPRINFYSEILKRFFFLPKNELSLAELRLHEKFRKALFNKEATMIKLIEQNDGIVF